jgi:phosphoribosylformylglycinamidine synthase
MWQLSEAIDGMGDACRALGLPVVGGNVSLYNESRGHDIDPTPIVGVVGMVDQLALPPPGVGLVIGTKVMVLGPSPSTLSGSHWAWRRGHKAGEPPALDLDAHAAVCGVVRDLVNDGLVLGVHDTADGGLAVALAEMAVASGVGATIAAPEDALLSWLFGEAPSRFVLSVDPAAVGEVQRRHMAAGVEGAIVGEARDDRLTITGGTWPAVDLGLAAVTAAWRGKLPALLGHGTTQG